MGFINKKFNYYKYILYIHKKKYRKGIFGEYEIKLIFIYFFIMFSLKQFTNKICEIENKFEIYLRKIFLLTV